MPFPFGSIPLTGAIGVGDSADTFGTHYDYLGVGGFRSVADDSEMQGIPALRRRKGMLVYKVDSHVIYKYMSADGSDINTIQTNSAETSGWVPLSFGGSSLPAYVDGRFLKSGTASASWVTLAISDVASLQAALDLKLASATAATTYAPLASPTFTGTVSGITKAMVGLSNVNNTSDADKPVSTATQTALDLKLNITASTETGGGGTLALVFSNTDTIYGSVTTAKTGNITTSTTSAKVGVTHIVIHNNTTTAPSISATNGSVFKLSGSGSYRVNVTNVIYFTCIDASTIVYSINQIIP
jgi:hypothetical protein